MRFLLLSDVHGIWRNPIARIDNIVETFDRKLNYILDYAEDNSLPILQAGDLTDTSRNWELLSYLLHNLNHRSVSIYTVFGQHDMYNRRNPEDTPSIMQMLRDTNIITVLSDEPVHLGKCNIYGANWGDEIPEVDKDKDRKNVLVIHASISLRAEYPGHDFTGPGYFLKQHPEFDLVLVGDVHKMFIAERSGRYIVNTGPMLRLEANIHMFEHEPCFFIWDSKKNNIEKHIIPHGAATDILTREHIDTNRTTKRELEKFTETLGKLTSLQGLRKEKIKNYIKKNVKNRRVRKIVEEIINGRYRKADGNNKGKIGDV